MIFYWGVFSSAFYCCAIHLMGGPLCETKMTFECIDFAWSRHSFSNRRRLVCCDGVWHDVLPPRDRGHGHGYVGRQGECHGLGRHHGPWPWWWSRPWPSPWAVARGPCPWCRLWPCLEVHVQNKASTTPLTIYPPPSREAYYDQSQRIRRAEQGLDRTCHVFLRVVYYCGAELSIAT